jgi:hypothetical protein
MQLAFLIVLVVAFVSSSYTVLVEHPEDREGDVELNDNLAVKHLENNLRQKREVGPDQGLDLLIKDEEKRAPMRFGKRAPMRFGKRAPMRFGKRDSDSDLAAIEFLRSARAPMRFGKRFYSFTKKAPMRFGKRAPMRFGKRDAEEPENTDEEYDDVIFTKRAPMRFGKRSDD